MSISFRKKLGLKWFSHLLVLCFDAIVGILVHRSRCKLSVCCIVHADSGIVALQVLVSVLIIAVFFFSLQEEEEEDDEDED